MSTIKSEYYRFNGSSWDLHYFKTSTDMVDGLTSALAGKATSVHYHDDRYYTKTEIQTSQIKMRNLKVESNGVPTNNFGQPSIAEMALFQEQFNNKTEFYDISKITFEAYDGSSWTDVTSSLAEKQRKVLVGGNGYSTIAIPNGWVKYRITLRATSYVTVSALYMYWSSEGNSTQVHIWKKHDSGEWTRHTNSTATVASWPGHLYLPFETVSWHPSATLGSHFHEIRIEFTPTWTNSNPIRFYKMQLWGGYPAHKRTIHKVNEDKRVLFPSSVAVDGDWNNRVYHPGNKPAWSEVTSKPSWIGSSKPTYTAADVGALPTTGGTLTGALNATDLYLKGINFDGEGGWISNLKSPEYGNQAATKEYVDTKVARYVPTTRTINGLALSSNIVLNTADIGDDDEQQFLDKTLADLKTGKLSTSDVIRSKNNLTVTSPGAGYSNTGLSVFLAANSTYKISMTGHWERQEPGATAWAYRQSITSSASGVYMRGMWTWYQEDASAGASTTIAYSDNMVSSSGATGQTVTTPSATTVVSYAPMCFEGYIVTGSSSTTITFRHGTSVSVYPPTRSAFRGVLTATKM